MASRRGSLSQLIDILWRGNEGRRKQRVRFVTMVEIGAIILGGAAAVLAG